MRAACARLAARSGNQPRLSHARPVVSPKRLPGAAGQGGPRWRADAPSELHPEAVDEGGTEIRCDRVDRARRVDHGATLRLFLGNRQESVLQSFVKGLAHSLIPLLFPCPSKASL